MTEDSHLIESTEFNYLWQKYISSRNPAIQTHAGILRGLR